LRGAVTFDTDAIGQPGAERNFRDFEIARAELTIFHEKLPVQG
jgi:hypothetical protein